MTRLRDRVGLNVPPLFLRLSLGIIFLWAGLAKVSETMEFSGDSAATLANMGVLLPLQTPTVVPAPKSESAPSKPPETKSPETKPPETKPAEPKAPESKPESKPGGGMSALPVAASRVALVRQQSSAKVYTAADFPKPVRARTVYMLALMLHNLANPDPAIGKMPLWPPSMASGSTPVYLAWAVAITELVGGLCMLLGMLTRLAALGVAGVMLGAMWLTQIGPAVQSGKTTLGFLPDYAAFDGEKWEPLLFQFVLCAAALALAFCGPGRLSLDTALLSSRGEGDDED